MFRVRYGLLLLFLSLCLSHCTSPSSADPEQWADGGESKQTFTLTVVKGAGGGTYRASEVVLVQANQPPSGKRFLYWVGDTKTVQDVDQSQTLVIMPSRDISLTATFASKKPVETFRLTVKSGKGSGLYHVGERVEVSAFPAPAGFVFARWRGDTKALQESEQASTTLAMPSQNVVIEATYQRASNNNNNNNAGKLFTLTVEGGKGTGQYKAGEKVPVAAEIGNSSVQFVRWVGPFGVLSSTTSIHAMVTMPPRDVTLRAVFRQLNRSQIIKAVMATDFLVTRDLWKQRKSDFLQWRKAGVNTLYSVVDLPTQCPKARPYILPGRTETSVNSVVVKNAKMIREQGFNVMLVLGNEPDVRSGFSSCMNGLGRKQLAPKDLYTSQRLKNEKAAWTDLYTKLEGKLHAAVLFREPSEPASILFVKSLAQHIRGLGFLGALYSNGVGKGRWDGDQTLRVYSASSIRDWKDWSRSTQDLRNADGMTALDESQAKAYIPQMTSKPGPHGFILWFSDYQGEAGGPGVLKDWHWKYIR